MTLAMFKELEKQAKQGNHNARVLVDRILAGKPMQGGKPIKIDG